MGTLAPVTAPQITAQRSLARVLGEHLHRAAGAVRPSLSHVQCFAMAAPALHVLHSVLRGVCRCVALDDAAKPRLRRWGFAIGVAHICGSGSGGAKDDALPNARPQLPLSTMGTCTMCLRLAPSLTRGRAAGQPPKLTI